MKYFIFLSIFSLSFLSGDTLDELANDKYWKMLLHIPNDSNISEIDSQEFFLSKEGKTNPKAELEETINRLKNEIPNTDDNSTQCKFPARTAFISEKLGLKFSKKTCGEFNKLYKKIDPKSVTVVFPNAHINSPASMFGHTFLRIDSTFSSKLLSHAINYAAMANQNTENGFIFALKGLFGGYYGKYSLLPYYEKLKEYSDTEQRDIWEYSLNLKKDEIDKMLNHIWELKDTYSYYYFFDENCSYNMLWLLEIARPTVNLRDQFTYHVSPPETLFAIKNQNMIDEITYRPSKRTKLLAYEYKLNSKELEIAKEFANGNIDFSHINKFEIEKQKYILECSIEFCEYLYIENKISKDIYLQTSHLLSASRAKLGQALSLDILKPKNPLDGHRQVKLTTGVKFDSGKSNYFFGVRPTYHSTKDSDVGFLTGTQIEFLEFSGIVNNSKVKVDKLSLLSIASIAQKTELFKQFSWRTNFGFDRNYINNDLLFLSSLSLGQSFNVLNKESYVYIFADIGRYEKSTNSSFGAMSAGFSLAFNEKLKINSEAKKIFYTSGVDQKSQNTSLNYFYNKSLSFGFENQIIDKFDGQNRNNKLILNLFF